MPPKKKKKQDQDEEQEESSEPSQGTIDRTKVLKQEFSFDISSKKMQEILKLTMLCVDEPIFTVKKGGLETTLVDPAHVCLLDMQLPKTMMENYKTKFNSKTDNFFDVLFSAEDMLSFLKVTKADKVTISYAEQDGKIVCVAGNLTRKFAIVDPGHLSKPKVPKLENMSYDVTIKAEHLAEGLKAAESISDHIILMCEKEKFTIRAEGDTDDMELELKKTELKSDGGDIKLLNEKVPTARSLFPLDYMSALSKVISCEKITMTVGDDYPVIINFATADLQGEIQYLLAPRISGE